MKSKTLTSIVREKNSVKLLKIIDHVPPLVANFFSVIFATSIILEISDVLSGIVLILLTVFIVLFLIQNEIIKVREIRKVFSGSKNSLIPFLITFIISIFLSTIGMYFYTNKSTEIKDNSTVEKNIKLNEIDQKYSEKFNTLYLNSFEETNEYKSTNKELSFWKSKSSATLIERTEIRERIDNLQKVIIEQKNVYNNNKNKQINQLKKLSNNEKTIITSQFDNKMNKTKTNDFVSYIFLSLILITEFATIVLNKNLVDKGRFVNEFANSKFAKKYLIASNLITALYLSARNNVVNINNAKYSLANKDNVLEWNEIKELYNIFISLGILSDGEIKKDGERELIYNKIIVTEKEAQKKLDVYFERFFKVV